MPCEHQQQHEWEVAEEKKVLTCIVGFKWPLMLTVQNELENITILFVNFKKKKPKVKSEGKSLKILTVSDQYDIIFIVIMLKVFSFFKNGHNATNTSRHKEDTDSGTTIIRSQ